MSADHLRIGIAVVAPPSGPICDFCSAPEVFASYPAVSFVHAVIEGTEVTSEDHWAACCTCAALIDADKWKEVLDRSVSEFFRLNGHGIPESAVREMIGTLHAQFRQHRKMSA